MNFLSYSDYIKEGDTVILYVGSKKLIAIEVRTKMLNRNNELVENVFQTNYGALKVESLIGKRYGSKIFLNGGYIYVLFPTSELWTITLSHRTQIIYTWDISIIVFQLDICPGSVVIEAGTGSGSVTHALARAVCPNGRIHTFEFHKDRASVAVSEFKNHGLSDVVTVYNQDVYASGFKELNNAVDAVFLDLPLPCLVIPHLLTSYKNKGGRFVSFCPCIEQVQSTCSALKEHGFVDIDTIECIPKDYDLVTRDLHIAGSKKSKQTKKRSPVPKKIRALTSNDGHAVRDDGDDDISDDRNDVTDGEGSVDNTVPGIDSDLSSLSESECYGGTIVDGRVRRKLCLCPEEMTGHTGYITYASLPPIWARRSKTSILNEKPTMGETLEDVTTTLS